MTFRPIQAEGRAEAVARQLEEAIREGTIRSGDQLPPEDELVRRLGVGRSSVREAKRILSARGFLAARAGRGTFITIPDQVTLDLAALHHRLAVPSWKHLAEARSSLEVQLAGLAAVRAEDDDLTRLEACLEGMERNQSRQEVHRISVSFHYCLAECAHNPILLEIYAVVSRALESILKPIYESSADPREACHSHRLLFNAVYSRDANRAQKQMRRHLGEVEVFVSKHLK